jgi:antirestriction protein ArdC
MRDQHFDIYQHIADRIVAAIGVGAGKWPAPANRCGRDLSGRFGSEAYAMEELVAELGAAFLCAELGITAELRADGAQYLSHWLTVLKADKRSVFTAASKAAEAVAFLREAHQLPG